MTHGTDFSFYKDGVYVNPGLGNYFTQNATGHALVIIGWGDDPVPHWIVHNSWGSDWGNNGKAKISRSYFDCMLAVY